MRPSPTGVQRSRILPHQAAATQPPAAIRTARRLLCSSSKKDTYEVVEERGVQFIPGDAFYRAESAQGRDLAVLAAAVHKQQTGQLRVLDVMSASGMRGARYLQQAGADLVWCNDYDRRQHTPLVYNLVRAVPRSSTSQQQQQQQQQQQNCSPQGSAEEDTHASCSSSSSSANTSDGGSSSSTNGDTPDASRSDRLSADQVAACVDTWTAQAEHLQYEGLRGGVLCWRHMHPGQQPDQQIGGGPLLAVPDCAQQQEQGQQQHQQQHKQQQQEQQHEQQWQQEARLTHVDARRLLASVYLAEEYFDLVDVDSFGSDTSHLPSAIDAVAYGGLLYLTSTDGLSAGGKRPERSLAAYGAYLRSLPSANEQGLRALIGAAVREGAARGVALTPLFSLFSYHGPVFRVMLRVSRGRGVQDLAHLGFVGHCYVHGQGYRVGWRGLSQAWCRCLERTAGGKATTAGKATSPAAVRHATGASAGRPVSGAGDTVPGAANGCWDSPSAPPPPAAAAAAARAAAGAGAGATRRPTPLVLSGPMWTGPLHDTAFVQAMADLASQWGWSGSAVPHDSPYLVRQSKNNRDCLQQQFRLAGLAREMGPARDSASPTELCQCLPQLALPVAKCLNMAATVLDVAARLAAT